MPRQTKDELIQATRDRDVESLTRFRLRLERYGKRSLYLFVKGSYESKVSPWLARAAEIAADPAKDAEYSAADVEFEALKRRVSAYQASNSFVRFFQWWFSSINRDIQLLCFYHARQLYNQFYPHNIHYYPRAEWKGPIDRFLSKDPRDSYDVHPARDIDYLRSGSDLSVLSEELRAFLPYLKARLPESEPLVTAAQLGLLPDGLASSSRAAASALSSESSDPKLPRPASPPSSYSASRREASTLVETALTRRVNAAAALFQVKDKATTWHEVLAVEEAVDAKALHQAYKDRSEDVGEDLVQADLDAAYIQAILEYKIDEAELRRGLAEVGLGDAVEFMLAFFTKVTQVMGGQLGALREEVAELKIIDRANSAGVAALSAKGEALSAGVAALSAGVAARSAGVAALSAKGEALSAGVATLSAKGKAADAEGKALSADVCSAERRVDELKTRVAAMLKREGMDFDEVMGGVSHKPATDNFSKTGSVNLSTRLFHERDSSSSDEESAAAPVAGRGSYSSST